MDQTFMKEKKILPLVLSMALPMIISMAVNSLYNIIDSIFIGHGVGAMAISGLAITFPLMNLAAAFGSLVGVGASTLVSVKLGQKDYSTAQQILGNVVSLNLIIGILFTILTLAFLDPILYFFGASEVTLPYARDYMVTILLGNVVTHMYLGLNSVLRSAGHPQKAMAATILTVVINTLLDPLFIYGLGMGIRGAVVTGGHSRLRPVIMTTLTTILGMVPMAIGTGQGSEMWRPMGTAVIGGLTVSTILTLILIPVLYCVFASVGVKRKRKKHHERLLQGVKINSNN